MKKLLTGLLTLAALTSTGQALATTGGGATIHNAATMSFSGGQVTASVDVEVLTIGTAPTITSETVTANAGDSVTVTYTITGNSNGSDIYDLTVSTNDTDVGAPSSLTITPPQVTLAGSVTSRPSQPGTIFIAAGSEDNLAPGDTVRINIGGTDYFYTVDSVTPGTPASTTGNTTTPETPTAVALTPQASAPAIIAGNVPVGTQVGEVQTFTVELDAGTPTTPGTPGEHEIVVDGTAAAPGPGGPGDVITFDNIGGGSVTVLSGSATLIKEVRNVTDGGAFATTGVTARTGDVLEYRLTAGTIPTETITGAVITDSIPEFTAYVPNSTTLNGNPVADVGPNSALVGGLQVNSATGAAGEIVDGETAVVTFQVTVQ
ncbi:MAG: hypothetical protein V2I38_15880 [Alcanivoracaceae bacterium]|jgi:uncharacterized repeat protein (TIGR01451 family)|nr:hypothetical protein [Alcanivoracaceae bacterium]